MTKRELIEMLEDVNDYAEVKIATQQNYPLAAKLSNVCIDRRDGDGEDAVVWLAAGDATEYAESRYWSEYDIEADERDGDGDEE